MANHYIEINVVLLSISHANSMECIIGWPKIWNFLKIIAPEVNLSWSMNENICDFFQLFLKKN